MSRTFPMLARSRVLIVVAALLILAGWQARTSSQSTATLTTPRQALGAEVGDDYFLATYTQLEQYWKTLDRESDRVSLADIGRTEEGRTQWMAIVSAPENIAALDRYKGISRRLALAEGLTEEEARTLSRAGRAVVWIDGGLHADETLGAQQLIELVYQLANASDEETLRVLRDVIVLVVHANPDGHELAASWYMRERDPGRRSLDGLPRLYQKYAGHDNNRDFYMSSQSETTNMNRVLFREWFPQIVLDHHQTSPAGTVMFAPPFRDPFNYVFDPLVPIGIDLAGAAIHARFAAEGKPGVTMRSGSTYSTWWNGGLRTSAYFHNQIGLLAETLGEPTPTRIPFVADRQIPSADLPFPIAPQTWHFRQSLDYVMTANRAILDAASRFRETVLLNAYRMGRNAIDRGSRDTWTMSPKRLAALAAASGGQARPPLRLYDEQLRNPATRDPRAYVVSALQPDFPTAVKFVNALLKSGVAVHRLTADAVVAGKSYPAGSFVVKTAQAFRPHVLDMFEPQDHPDETPAPGVAPTAPYDNAGWTLAYQMGVGFDRLLDPFDGPLEIVTTARPLSARISGPAQAAGYMLSHRQNDAFTAVNRLLAAGDQVYWLRGGTVGNSPAGEQARPSGVPSSGDSGAIYVPNATGTRARLEKAIEDLGISVSGVGTPPDGSAGEALKLSPVRVGLWDQYGGSTTSGWIRWILERFECPYELVFAQTLDEGDLAKRYDVIILPSDAVPGRGADGGSVANVPVQHRGAIGRMSWDRTVPELKRFVEDGGTLVAIGGATTIAERLGVPVRSALTVSDASGRNRALSSSEFYVPGSILRVAVDSTLPPGFGLPRDLDVFFDASPAFVLQPGARERGVRRIAWFASASPLRSGWARGQQYLNGAAAVVEAPLGKGRVLLYGPEITYRAQSHGTFKLLFNAIHYARATPARVK